MRTAYDLVWMAAQRTPDHMALVDDLTDRRLTYSQLIDTVDVLAAGLKERGIGAGTRVATVLPSTFDHALLLLALQRLAAVAALVNVRLKGAEVAQIARESELAAAVTPADGGLVAALRQVMGARAPLITVGGLVAGASEELEACRGDASALPPRPQPDAEAEAFLFYTSGTTGPPKAVVLAHRTSEPRVVWLSTMLGLRAGSGMRSLGVSPLSHAIGFHGVFLATLAYGGTYFVCSAFDPDRAVELVDRHRITYLFSLPSIYSAMVNSPSYDADRMKSLETVYFGGAPIEPALLDQIHREWPAQLGHVYGTTETMCVLVNPEPVGQPERLWQTYSSRVRVVRTGDTSCEAEVGEVGELLIDATGDAVFSGYLNRPKATADKLRGNWYHSGDAAVVAGDGGIRLVGRVDDMIRSGGEYIQPEEVENILRTHPHVRDAALVGIADAKWGQVAVACVVPRGEPLDPADIDRHCRGSTLADFKRPRAYLFIEALPTGAGNKLLRGDLRARASKAAATEGGDRLHRPPNK